MSHRIMQAVLDTSNQSGSALLLLLVLAFHANDQGLAWPRIDTLVAETRLGARYVRKLLASLAQAGELRVEPHEFDGRRHAYRLSRYCPSDSGTGVPTTTGTPVPHSDHGRNPGSADSRNGRPAIWRNPGSPCSKEELSFQPSTNPLSPRWAERVERILAIWDGCEPHVERPPDGRVGVWLQAWDDDEALSAVLVRLRRRGAFDLSVNYVHTCLATALRNGRRLRMTREEREIAELQAPGLRIPAPPIDVRARLAALAASLPLSLPDRGRWVQELLGLGDRDLDVQRIEEALAHLDSRLLVDLGSTLDAKDLDAAVQLTFARLGGRLPKSERARTAQMLRRRLVRRRFDVPVLSLFSLVAERSVGSDKPEDGDVDA